jgi:hypothetical protein
MYIDTVGSGDRQGTYPAESDYYDRPEKSTTATGDGAARIEADE